MSDAPRISELLARHDVVLFMKGTRRAPQCGFSASVVDILDDFLEDYLTVDVLADPGIRDAVKAHSDWPTLPQLYVRGQFVGGADIVRELRASGELEATLGRAPLVLETPDVTVTDGAIGAFARFWEGEGKPVVRLEVDREFRAGLAFEPPRDGDLVLDDARFALVLDRQTARRVDGVVIDWVDTPEGGGFRIDNPSAPPTVRPVTPAQLRDWRAAGKPLTLFDVRTEEEREQAAIEGSVFLDAAGRAILEDLDRAATVVFYCHHGIRSAAAAEHALRLGFRDVWNLAGGIDAWSRTVDPTVPRY